MKLKLSKKLPYEDDIKKILALHGFVLVDYKIRSQGPKKYFSITMDSIDPSSPVKLSDCKLIIKQIKRYMDTKDENELPDYVIGVFSPGVSRKLKSTRELEAYLHKNLLLKPIGNNPRPVILEGFSSEFVKVKDPKTQDVMEILFENIEWIERY